MWHLYTSLINDQVWKFEAFTAFLVKFLAFAPSNESVNQAWEWLRIYSGFSFFFFLVKCSNKPSSFITCENPGKWKGSMEKPWEKVLLKTPQNIRFWGEKILKNFFLPKPSEILLEYWMIQLCVYCMYEKQSWKVYYVL